MVNTMFNNDFAFDMLRSLDLLYVLFTVTRKNMVLGYQGTSFYGWMGRSWIGVIKDAI